MKSIKELADICQDRAMNYGGLDGLPDNVVMFDKWQKLSDYLKQVNILLEDLDEDTLINMTERMNFEVGRRLLPLEGYTFHCWQAECSRLWYWYIRSEQYGQLLIQPGNGFVEKGDCMHNLELVRRAFAEEQKR